MDKDYIQRLKDEVPVFQAKLKEIEKNFGKYSERWHIANENLIKRKQFIKQGVPKQVHQSTEIPYDLTQGF